MFLKNKICGSAWGVGSPNACTGVQTTYTTADGRTAWVTLYRFFKDNARAFPLRRQGKDWFLLYPEGRLGAGVFKRRPPLFASCRVRACTAYLFFPDLARGRTVSPGVPAGE